MAIVTIPKQDRTINDPEEVTRFLAGQGIDYERWQSSHPVAAGAPADEILKAYTAEIERLKESGGYLTADVIDVTPQTPGLAEMLKKFSREHWHADDEVRFIIEGRGLFHIHPGSDAQTTDVFAIEVVAGDLIRVPSGTLHWFNLCGEQRIRAIRLFKDPAGWAPTYTSSGVDDSYQPLCLGTTYLPAQGLSMS